MRRKSKNYSYYILITTGVILYLVTYYFLFFTYGPGSLHTLSIILGIFMLSAFLLILSLLYKNRFIFIGSIIMMATTFTEVVMILVLGYDATEYAFLELSFQFVSSVGLLLITGGIFNAFQFISKQSSILKGAFDQNDALYLEYKPQEEVFELEFSDHFTNKYPHIVKHQTFTKTTFLNEVLSEETDVLKYIVTPTVHDFIISLKFSGNNQDINILFKTTKRDVNSYQFVGIDVTDLLRTEKTLLAVNEERATMLDNLPVGVARMEMIYNAVGEPINYRYLYANKTFFEQTQLKPEHVINHLVTDFVPISPMKRIHQYNQVVNSNHVVTFRGNLLDPNREILITAYGQKNNQFIAIFQDISEIVSLTKQLEHQLLHDPLTDVYNYKGLLDVLHRARMTQAVCFQFDIEHFSIISDFYGHEIGDQIILVVLNDIKSALFTEAFIARIKHDQFVVYFLDPQEEDIKTYIRLFQSTVIQQYDVGIMPIQVKKNIGYARYPADASSPIDIIALAGLAMRENAESELTSIVKYQQSFITKIERRLHTASKLKDAIDKRIIDICFQKVVDVSNQEVKYVEALARWLDADLGRIPPDTFIPVARQSSMLEALEKYLIEKSLMYYQTVSQVRNYHHSKLCINLSPTSLLSSEMPDFIVSMAYQYGINPDQIVIEISENTFVHSLQECKQAIDLFKAKGFLIAIDDFGSKYSSLSILGNINYDIIKIDGAFVKHLHMDNNTAIVEMICRIAQNSQKEIIAESVENQESAKKLVELGCYLHQGFYYHIPDKLCD